MFAFGHAGLTVAAAHAADRDTDLRWAALLAVGPDVLDKPLSVLLKSYVNGNTRNFGHTLAFSLVLLGLLLVWKRRPKPALILWGCWVGHLLLDAMWLPPSPAVFFWPLLGPFPYPIRGPLVFSWILVWYLAGEIAGVFLLARLMKRHGLEDTSRFTEFLRLGRLP